MQFSKKFVCEDRAYSTYQKNVPSPLFRKSFFLDDAAETAEIRICGMGFYDLFVNGNKITKGYLAPYISNSDHICYYDDYDIKPYLQRGENVIGVMLGDGHQVGKAVVWDFDRNDFTTAPLLALSVRIQTDAAELCFDAEDFVCKKGPILFNDLRSGVFYDARLEEPGWCAPGFEEKDWHRPIVGAYHPRGYAKLCEAEPIRVVREIKPIQITKGALMPYTEDPQVHRPGESTAAFETAAEPQGGYIYDFGENQAGIFRLKIKAERGQKISLQCAEQLVDGKVDHTNIYFYPDGFSQRDIYYAKGEGEEIFEPMFTYHGFRYVYVSGITPEQATEDLLTYLVMHSDLEERGRFSSSDDIANQIDQMAKRSDESNFYYFPTDCPHREKNGWTGDAAVSAEHMIMTMGTEKSWREWLHNIRAAQRENGELPGIVPTGSWGYEWGNGPAWDCVIFYLPYYAYLYRGDTDIIRENADAMLRYLSYIAQRRDEKGIVAVGLGDWVPVVRSDGGRLSEVSLGFTDSVMVYDMCRKAEVMFEKIGLPLHLDFAKKLGDEMRAAIRREYIDFSTYVVDGRYQTSQAMAIFFDILDEDEKPKAFRVLLDIIHEDHDSITGGHLGLRVVFHVLAEFGEAELAYRMITKSDFPSYGYWAAQGETTLLERFEEYDGHYPLSKNHHFLGDVRNWLMRYPGGIRVQSADEVVIRPYYLQSMQTCSATHRLRGGAVTVDWKREDHKIVLCVRTEGEIRCTVEPGDGTTHVCDREETYVIAENA